MAITVSPLSGYKYLTPFVVSISPSGTDNLINWGDQNFDQTSTATHYYSAADVYTIYSGNCGATSALSVSVYNGPFFENTISVSAQSVSAYAGCDTQFLISVSSVSPSATIFLYSSGSNSYPYSDTTFWSHLNPSWEFKSDDVIISELNMELVPVISGGYLLGYSGNSAVSYVDDMPGNPYLWFTLKQEEGINSRVYSSVSHYISADIPTELIFTSDGISQINKTQFGDIEIPYIISVGGQHGCSNIMHYASGNILGTKPVQGCNGIPSSSYVFPLSTIYLSDGDFNTGGYLKTSLTVPASAIPQNSLELKYYVDQCGNPTPELQEYSEVQNNPFSITLSACADIVVNGQTYSISGISSEFDVYRLDKFHDFYRKGEDKTVYDLIKKYSHFDLDEYPKFDTYLSAIAGPGDTLGKAYDLIQNFHLDHSDIDLCNIEALTNMGQMLDNPVDDFGLTYPEELRRLMNFCSIPVNKLIGTRCVCNQNFNNCNSCKGQNICGLCGFDKKSNVGPLLQYGDTVYENQTVLVRENGSDVYDFYLVPQTTMVKNLTALDLDNYCVFEWNAVHQNNPVESVIDYKNPGTTVSRSLSTTTDWIADDGVMECVIQRVLVQNLINI